jgi:DNA-binding MarR family transcriptional regulator
MVLYLIPSTGGKVGATELSRLLCRRPHSVYELLVRMENAGFVRKIRRAQTKRKSVVRFKLTKEGFQCYTQLLSMESIAKLMSKLSEQDLQRLKSYLEAILEPIAQ